MHWVYELIISESSEISSLTCYQLVAGGSHFSCSWLANPPSPFYEVVLSTLDGSRILRESTIIESIIVELEGYAGKEIVVSVNNVLTKIQVYGMSVTILLRSAHLRFWFLFMLLLIIVLTLQKFGIRVRYFRVITKTYFAQNSIKCIGQLQRHC